ASVASALARSAIATAMLPLGLLREGNGVVNLITGATGALGPALGGVLVAWQGAHLALLADAASFAAAAVIVASGKGIRVISDQRAQASGRLRSGLAVVRNHATVRRLVVVFGATVLFGSMVLPIEVVFAKHTLHAGDAGYGALLAFWGAGMLLGGAAFMKAGNTRLSSAITFGTLAMAGAYAGLAGAPSLAVACGFSLLGGVGNGSGVVALLTAIQERVPLANQSVVISVLSGMNQLLPALGFAVGGAVTALTSPRLAYAVAAAGLGLLLAGLVGWRLETQDETELSGDREVLPTTPESPTEAAPAGAGSLG
ncbi:MAG: MFS transporter, partial [Solirubrobacteraceae bacterium]